MNAEEIFEFADQAVFASTGQRLSDIQKDILIGSWEKQEYRTIAEKYHCEEQHAKNVGAKLWILLSQVLGEKVTKKNFRAAFERRWQSHSPTPTQPKEAEEGKSEKFSNFKLQPLTERVREWQLEGNSYYQELDAIETNIFNDRSFVGREKAIVDLNNLIDQGVKVILIQAEGGVGKTTLAKKWFECQGLEFIKLVVGRTSDNISSVEDWLRDKLVNRFGQMNPECDFFTMLEQFKRNLQSQRIGILIDNLEPALINGQFVEPYRSHYIELFTSLADSSLDSVTLITSREPLYEPEIKGSQTVQTYPLEGLTKDAWEEYLYKSNISIDTDTLDEIHRAYGGNAEVMYILTGDIKNEFQGDLNAYWRDNSNDLLVNPTLENLVKRQLDKLKNDNLQAYKLLCRMAFYPDIDVSYVPKAWLFLLLWDAPKKRRNRVIYELRDRSLVKFHIDGYYLHPVIRLEAIERLRSIEEIEAEKLYLIKEEIDKVLAPYQKLQKFLEFVKEKSNLVNVPCNPVNVRAFYYSLFYDLTTTRHIAGELGSVCKFEDVDDDIFDYDRVYEYLYDLYLDLSLVSTVSCESYDEFAEDISFCTVDPVRDPAILKSLQTIQSELSELEKNYDKFEQEWMEDQSLLKESLWSIKGKDWIEILREKATFYRKLALDWHLSKDEIRLLDEYYDTNKMLVDCLNSCFEGNYKIRTYLETTLFLPINEINKLTFEK